MTITEIVALIINFALGVLYAFFWFHIGKSVGAKEERQRQRDDFEAEDAA